MEEFDWGELKEELKRIEGTIALVAVVCVLVLSAVIMLERPHTKTCTPTTCNVSGLVFGISPEDISNDVCYNESGTAVFCGNITFNDDYLIPPKYEEEE